MFVVLGATNISESLVLIISPKQIENIQRFWAVNGYHPGKLYLPGFTGKVGVALLVL
jgi:hypothetical protein